MQLYGYRRPDGRVGFRNHVLILPTAICSVSVAEKIAQLVPGTTWANNNTGCCLLGEDIDIYRRTIVNTAGHPNVAATLIIGLGCETISDAMAAAEIEKFGKPVRHLAIQTDGGVRGTIEKGVILAKELLAYASKSKREPASVSDLIVGLECGGSDPASGITANPATGAAVDRVIDEGGSAILGETDEWIGAEMILTSRAKTKAIARDTLRLVRRFERHVKAHGSNLSDGQPTRGNQAAGLSTIEEKSLGCISKLGSREISEVLEYSEIPTKKGAILLDTPGFDVTSVVGIVAGGCQVMVFTTGLGTPVGNPITPVIKVSSNSLTYERMNDVIDINAGTILEGKETIAGVGNRIYEMILRVLSGEMPKAEQLGQIQYGIWRATTEL